MKLRNIERFEIVVRRFDFRTLHDGKSDGNENIFDLLKNLTNQMPGTDGTNDTRKRKVHALFCESRFFGARLNCDAARFNLRVHVSAKFVQARSNHALQFRRGGFQPIVRDAGENAGFAAKPSVTELLECSFVADCSGLGIKARANFREQERELLRLRNAESGESFVVRTVSGRHDGEIEYIERRQIPCFARATTNRTSQQPRGHDLSCPYGKAILRHSKR